MEYITAIIRGLITLPSKKVSFYIVWSLTIILVIGCAYKNVNSAHEHSKYSPKYNKDKEDTAFYSAQSIDEFEQFIRRYPQSHHVKMAKKMIIGYLRCDEKWKKYAKAIADFTDISGALYDSNTGFIYIIGDNITNNKNNSPLPPLLLDDILTIFKLIEQNKFPGVSIEPAQGMYSKTNFKESVHIIRYIPESTRNTHLGGILFEIDRQLKSFSHGRDTITNEPIVLSNQEYVPSHELADMSMSSGFYGRTWFKPKKSSIYHKGNKIWFKEYKMGVLVESDDPGPRFFANNFEMNFDKIAKDIPVFRELIRLGKIVALATWLKQNGIVMDPSIIDNYTFMQINTPKDTPVIKGIVGKKKVIKGNKIYEYEQYIVGGINFFTRNDYKSFSSPAVGSEVKNEIVYYWEDVAKKIKSSSNKVSWDISKGEKEYSVVKFPFTQKSLDVIYF